VAAGLRSVDYRKCERCGFVLSQTHAEMPKAQWAQLNEAFNDYIDDPQNVLTGGPAPIIEQATMIALLGGAGLIDATDLLDYAGGRGYLSGALEKYFSLHAPIYDPYVVDRGRRTYVDVLRPTGYGTVINSAMFEHVLGRGDLDAVNAAVSDDGALIIHTLVCERVPNDPDWFYLDPPVHTAFHTNASMEILMSQWGYRSSIYSTRSKCWALLRQDYGRVGPKIEAINRELQTDWLIGKSGFVDYWKGF
jgi:hypothetical protein